MSAGLSSAISSSGAPSSILTQNSARSYTARLWITGSPIALDSDPNSVAPSASRIFTIPHYCVAFISGFNSGVGPTVAAAMGDGVTCTVRHWFYDDSMLIWTPTNLPLALTYATTALNFTIGAAMLGNRLFTQVTANNGCTKLAILVR